MIFPKQVVFSASVTVCWSWNWGGRYPEIVCTISHLFARWADKPQAAAIHEFLTIFPPYAPPSLFTCTLMLQNKQGKTFNSLMFL